MDLIRPLFNAGFSDELLRAARSNINMPIVGGTLSEVAGIVRQSGFPPFTSKRTTPRSTAYSTSRAAARTSSGNPCDDPISIPDGGHDTDNGDYGENADGFGDDGEFTWEDYSDDYDDSDEYGDCGHGGGGGSSGSGGSGSGGSGSGGTKGHVNCNSDMKQMGIHCYSD